MSMMMAKCCCNTGTACGCTGLPSSVIVIATIEDCCGNASSHSMVAQLGNHCGFSCPCVAFEWVGVGRTEDPTCSGQYNCNLPTARHRYCCNENKGRVFMRAVGVGVVPSDSESYPCAGWCAYVGFTAFTAGNDNDFEPRASSNDECERCHWGHKTDCLSPVSQVEFEYRRCCFGSNTWACSYTENDPAVIGGCYIEPPTPCQDGGESCGDYGPGYLVSISVG